MTKLSSVNFHAYLPFDEEKAVKTVEEQELRVNLDEGILADLTIALQGVVN